MLITWKNPMRKSDLFKILKLTLLALVFLYLYALSKFNFNFHKIDLISIVKWFPILFILFLLCFLINRFIGRSN